MSLTWAETKKLLAVIAVLDDKETDDPLLIKVWQSMSVEGDWPSFAAAERALFVHRSEQPDYPIRPGHITQVLNRVRSAASAAFQKLDLDPSDEVRETPQTYQAWVRERVTEHQARAMAAFVQGEVRPPKAIEAA